LNEYLLIDDNPFGFNALTYVRKVEVSKQLNDMDEACIIISSSGMMNAGRVRHHLFNSIDQKKNTILIVGYCSPGTPGGMLRNGVQKLKLFRQWMPVHADIQVMDSFSAHADRNEIKDFIANQKGRVRKIFLVHGELDRQQSFREFIKPDGFKEVEIPEIGDVVEL